MPYSTPYTVTGRSEPPRWDDCSQLTSLWFPPCHQTFPLHPTLQHFQITSQETEELHIFQMFIGCMQQTTSRPPAFQSSTHRPLGRQKDILGIQTTSADSSSTLSPDCLTGIATMHDPQDKG